MTELELDESRVLKYNYKQYIITKRDNSTIKVSKKISVSDRKLKKEELEANERSWYSYFNPFSYF